VLATVSTGWRRQGLDWRFTVIPPPPSRKINPSRLPPSEPRLTIVGHLVSTAVDTQPPVRLRSTVDALAIHAKLAHMEALLNGSEQANGSTRIRPGRRHALRQALQIQERVYEESLKSGVKPSDLAQLARAWDCLEERKRILRGRPLPGSLKPEKLKRNAKPPWLAEPVE
jgi:hypothetical protein